MTDLENTCGELKSKCKPIMSWTLMAQNREICIITSKGNVKFLDIKLLPKDLYLEQDDNDFDIMFNNRINFEAWCANRILCLDRKYAKEILNAINVKQAKNDSDRARIALLFKCLSIKDFYWVRTDAGDTWESINLFKNSVGEIVDIALRGKALTLNATSFADKDIATDGVAPKAWVRDGNNLYMLKGGTEDVIYNEVEASRVLRRLGFDVLEYELAKLKDGVVSKCECFTDENTGFVTAGDYNMNYDLNVEVTAKYLKEYYTMVLCDYLVGNSDRHQDNWGLMFDKNCTLTGLTPVFDFDHAFKAPPEYNSLSHQLLTGEIVSMLDVAKKAVKYLGIDINKMLELCDNNYVYKRLLLL